MGVGAGREEGMDCGGKKLSKYTEHCKESNLACHLFTTISKYTIQCNRSHQSGPGRSQTYSTSVLVPTK